MAALRQDCVAKVLDVLTTQNKDVRKATWTNKEVRLRCALMQEY